MSGDERITDPATIRTYWEDDEEVTRIVRRVAGALNSGRDKAVVEVVLDETEALRRENETLRRGMKDLVEHKAGEEPTNDVVEAFQILEDETADRNQLARRVFEMDLAIHSLTGQLDEAQAFLEQRSEALNRTGRQNDELRAQLAALTGATDAHLAHRLDWATGNNGHALLEQIRAEGLDVIVVRPEQANA